MALDSLALDEEFVERMDQQSSIDNNLDGDKRVRLAVTLSRYLTSFCRPQFHRTHPLALKRHKYERWWFNFCAGGYIFSITMICISLFHHYVHEYHLLQCHEFNQTKHRLGLPTDKVARLEFFLLDQMEASRRQLIAAGAPLVSLVEDYPFAVICFYIFWLGFSLGCYVSLVIYFRYVTPVETLYFLRVVTDPRREQHLTNTLIKDHVNRVIESSKHHAERQIKSRLLMLDTKMSHNLLYGRRDDMIAKYKRDYCSDAETLARFSLEGRLNPISRSPEWIDTLALYYSVLTYYLYAVIGLLFLSGPLIFTFYISVVDAMGIVVLLAIVLDSLIFSGSGVFYLATVVLTLVDQIRSVEYIHSRVNEHIVCTEKILLANHRDHETIKLKRLAMNDNLLLLLMEYKIFKSQQEEFHNILRYMTPLSYFLVFLIPVTGRIHLAYMRIPSIRFFLIALSVFAMIFCDLFIIPACYFQTRCLKLQNTLSSLQAHVIHCFNMKKRHHRHLLYYKDHNVLLLTCEYSNHNQLEGSQGLFNYGKALKLHFWLSIVILSIWFESKNSSNRVLTGIFGDPLNLMQVNI